MTNYAYQKEDSWRDGSYNPHNFVTAVVHYDTKFTSYRIERKDEEDFKFWVMWAFGTDGMDYSNEDEPDLFFDDNDIRVYLEE